MDKSAFKDLLTRYLANECTSQECLLVERLYELLGEEKNLVIENLDNLEDEIWNRVKGKTFLVKEDIAPKSAKIVSHKKWYQQSSWRVAASVLLLCTVGFVAFQLTPETNEPDELALLPQSTIVNKEEVAMDVWLEDSSRVTLYPNGQLNIPIAFNAHDAREVFLTGEADFYVTKDANKPFLVYSGEVTTRVVGTSFKINSDRGSGNVEVEVLSGKVSVYNDSDKEQKRKSTNGVVLTPNQKVTYHTENKQFVTAVVDDPVLLEVSEDDQAEKPTFVYNDTQIEEVMEQLETSYGIQIEVVDNDRFAMCPLTANLSRESLHDKLEMICTSLNAAYEVKGTTILITGRGCN